MGKQRPALAAAMAAAGIAGLYRWVVRPKMYTWGATAAEIAAELPGDGLVEPGPRTTRAITIDAPVDEVWPWLAQIGENRGGFYSYDVLERLVGARIRNAEVVPKSHLVLMSAPDYERVQRGEKAFGSWAFCLRPQSGQTRLVARGAGGAVGRFSFDVVHFVMERGMLRGIRRRAQSGRSGVGPVPLPRR